MSDFFRAQGLTMRFGGLIALRDLDLPLRQGELVGLIGPNGAGKTTAFNVFTGRVTPSAGRVVFQGREVTGLKPHRINRLGIGRTFQDIHLFAELSVLENVMIGYHGRVRSTFFGPILGLPQYRREEAAQAEGSLGLLEEVGLAHLAWERAGSLAYGQQRRLEIARALATGPRLLLLDEPAAGMNPQETVELMDLIRALRDRRGLTILLIEHDMRVIMGLCERIVVLDLGVTIAQGTPAEVQQDPRVIRAYLGGGGRE